MKEEASTTARDAQTSPKARAVLGASDSSMCLLPSTSSVANSNTPPLALLNCWCVSVCARQPAASRECAHARLTACIHGHGHQCRLHLAELSLAPTAVAIVVIFGENGRPAMLSAQLGQGHAPSHANHKEAPQKRERAHACNKLHHSKQRRLQQLEQLRVAFIPSCVHACRHRCVRTGSQLPRTDAWTL